MKIIPLFTMGLERLFSSFPFLVKLYSLYYRGIVKREVQLGEISAEDRVLCIGGGPLPCTALEIASRTGANVLAVDIDPKAVKLARKAIKMVGMENKIKVALASGQEIDASNFTVVHVALQAQPHEEILRNIWEKATCGTRILIRSPKDCLKRFYSAISWEHNCDHCKYVQQKYCTMKATLLFEKTRGALEHEEAFNATSSISSNTINSMVG